MMFFLYSLHVLISLFLIAVVLLQQGKGADLSVFGGGATQTAFGARGAATVLHKLTVGFFVAFIATTLAIGVVQKSQSESVIRSLPETAVTDTADEAPVEESGALPTGSEATEADATDDGVTDGDATDAASTATGETPAADESEAGVTPAAESGDS